MLTVSKLHDFFVTDIESGDDREEFETCYKDIYGEYDSSDISTAKTIFKILLEAWMYGYKTIYTKTHYRPLLLRILELVSQRKTLNFVLPGFPAKSANRDERVLGVHADFAEVLALRTFIETARKIEEVYSNGTLITIMADPKTLDDVGTDVSSEDYDIYYNDLNEMIRKLGAGDIIKLISVAATPEFQENNDLKSNYIRISIHHHHPRTEKFPIDLYKKHDCNKSFLRAPWRHAVMYDTLRSEFVVDHKSHLLKSSDKMTPVFMINYGNHSHLLVKLRYADDIAEEDISCENDLELSFIKSTTGLIIENKSGNNNMKSSIFHPDCITSLVEEFGAVILNGFDKFQDEEQIVDFYSTHGNLGLVQWEFGPLRKGKPYKECAGFVKENIDSTIHWDLMAPPQYMGIHQSMYTYEESTAKEFMIYCQKNLSKKGITTFIDAYTAALALPGDKKLKWKNTTLVYEDKANHKNNETRHRRKYYEYPLIHTCPWTKKEVFRWGEICTDKRNLNGTQRLTYNIKQGSETDSTPSELEEEIKQLLFDDRFVFEYTFRESDQVFVNNYTTLHGTKGFVKDSELWKLHLVPSSDNIPDYFQNI